MKARGRMRTGILTALTTGVFIAAAGSTAFALSVDFTDTTWNGAHGLTSFLSHPSGVDLVAVGGKITVNYNGGPSGDNSGMDGLGIGDDEITQGGVERLTVAFAAPVYLEKVYITDLFLNEGPNRRPEVGLYSLNGGGTFTSFASVGGANGALTLNIFQSGVNSIVFKSSMDSFSDYSIKGLNYSVPEPSTVLLLGFGLIMFLALARKQLARTDP